jgi:acyl-CoA synthetase (AMP-forming)/AMP-acid ligase II
VTFLLATLVADLAAERPEAPAVTLGDRTTTFRQLDERSSQLAHAMLREGVGRGTRVGVMSRNSPLMWEAAFACSKIGAVLVAINWRLSTREVTSIVADANPLLVLAQDEFLPRLVDVEADIVTLDEQYEKLIAGEATNPPETEIDPDDVVLQLYSSGTTGRPKGVLITHRNLAASPLSGEHLYRMDATSVNLVVSPLFHIGGIGYGMTTLSRGGHTVLVHEADGVSLLRTIEQHGVTHSFLVPSIIQSLVEAPTIGETDLSSLKFIAYGGAPMSAALLRRAMDALGCGFLGVYGMTETSGTVIALYEDDHQPEGERSHLLRSCGKPLPWMGEAGVFDPFSGEPALVGQVGEIWVRSTMNTPGYWNQPAATEETLLSSGWLRTGDAAYLDDEGYFYIHDRMKDMIISGGENIYPAEVESVLHEIPEILEVAVIGVPSERWGETVKAMVVKRDGVDTTEAAIIAFARDNLAHYKCPTSVDFVAELPRNATGKILKTELRSHYRETVRGGA